MVFGIFLDDAVAAQLESAFGRSFRQADDVGEVLAAVKRGRASAVILDVWDGSGVPLAPVVRRMRDCRPALPIVVCSRPRPESLREMLKLAAAGATAVVISGVDQWQPGEIWRQLVGRVPSQSITDEVLSSLRGRLDPRLEPAARFCLDNATQMLRTPAVCAAVGVTQRTLSSWASEAGLAGVRGLIVACKSSVAIALVAGLKETVEAAALTLGFSSASHLLNTVKRRTGSTFSAIRAEPDLPQWWRRTFGLPE